jgi:hypothetical protein
MFSPVAVQTQNGHFSVMGIRKIINSLPPAPSEIASQFPSPRTFEFFFDKQQTFFQIYNDSGSIVDFEEMVNLATSKNKFVVTANELIFEEVNVLTKNKIMVNLAAKLDKLSLKTTTGTTIPEQWKKVRLDLDPRKITVASMILPVGKSKGMTTFLKLANCQKVEGILGQKGAFFSYRSEADME